MTATASPPTLVPPGLDDTIEPWLEARLLGNVAQFAQRPVLLDVGAYQGKFARRFLNLQPAAFREAVLFEPNPENFAKLQTDFSSDHRVRLEPVGCDTQAGTHEFFCRGETYTGSLLPYADAERNGTGTKQTVQLIALDEFLAMHGLRDRIGLLKIDTQGNDLRVLQGAVETLRASRPWLVVELIYTPLYVGQASPSALGVWLAGQNYVWAGQFNEYYSEDGWLGWADGCFVPREAVRTGEVKYFKRPTAARARKEHGFWRSIKRRLRGR